MKTPLLKITLLAAIISFVFISCNNSPKDKEKNLNDAMDKVQEAKEELSNSTLDSISDFQKYKSSIETKLVENEKIIANLKSNNTSKDESTKKLYRNQLDKLKMKNEELKAKIENYKESPEQKWELFKVDFNKDMDDLGKSISNMAERNMKK
ncbi:hypothetical protein [Flavobacterium sp.]|uniref:hypothetical protein n=1 Tax=Flavobacterium sp. TaxID=239 RepID=UPI003BC5E492